nr:receptor-like protein 34 [Ziziphus jujuba var. spinosa]
MLEGIVVSNNRLHDVFPSWLGSLPFLKLLILQSNGLYGVIEKPKSHLEFPKLQVIDISFNNFTSKLPSHYIVSWNAMKPIDPDPFTYLSVSLNYLVSKAYLFQVENRFPITLTSKGVKRYYGAIQDILAFIDMSSNKFEEEISELFANLKAFHSLNLSNNMLTGCIPSSLGNLTPSCHDNERSSLLQFNEIFVIIKKSTSLCDPKYNSYNTLFNLVHLQRLNVAGNNFNYSKIPAAIGRLLGLTYLNLSGSAFLGQIPIEISYFFKLSQLDLSFNFNGNVEQKVLEVKNPNLTILQQNLTSSEVLDLSFVNISSMVPNFLSNFTSLTSLSLMSCGLPGEFPAAIFQLPYLRILDVGSNKNLNGYLPDSTIKVLL